MNVLFIAAESSISGANKSMNILIENIKKEKNNVFVVLPNNGDIEKELKARNIEYFIVNSKPWTVDVKTSKFINILRSLRRKIYNIKAIKQIQKIINKYDIDIVHNNSISSYVGPIAGYKENCKVIWHLREFLEEDHGLKICDGFNHKKVINKANNIIAISKCVYDKYIKIYNKEKLILIYNGIDVDEFSYKKSILENEKIKIAIIGRITEGKGQKELVEAINVLDKKSREKLEVYLVGNNNGEYAIELAKYINNHQLDKTIKFCGIVYNIKDFYKDIDIIIVTSRNEAFGRTTIEAMMESCLVIGANTAGTRELILNEEKYGLLYEQGNYKSLANKITWAINNKELVNKIVNEAFYYARINFNAFVNAENIIKIYKTK